MQEYEYTSQPIVDFAKALLDMGQIEGALEKKRRELALRSDFNMGDTYKMITCLNLYKRGADCDDLFSTIVNNLQVTITRDECFLMFYKLDKDGDGYLSADEVKAGFMPRSKEYAVLVETRGAFYGSETDVNKFFEGNTRKLMKVFFKGFIDCEVSVELIR